MRSFLKRLGTVCLVMILSVGLTGTVFAQSEDSTKAAPSEPDSTATAKKKEPAKPPASGKAATAKKRQQAPPPNSTPPGKLHTIEQIMEVIKKSELYYELDTVRMLTRDLLLSDTARPMVPENQHIKMVGGRPTLTRYKLSSMGSPLMGMADEAMQQRDYGTTLTRYRQIMGSDPNFDPIYMLLGDLYLAQDSLDSAKVNLQQAVNLNFIDFKAHQLLAETFWKMGKRDSAVAEMTIAHVLNINDPKIKGELENYRMSSGRYWNGRAINPQYRILKKGDTIKVMATQDWIGYATVKAVWRYEPGYARKMLGFDPAGNTFTMMEEKEALIGSMMANKDLGLINPAIEQGYFDEFVLYEIAGPRHPLNLIVLPKEVIMRVAQYVDKFR